MAEHARHAQRGQAIFETLICLPMFLFVFWATIWVAQIAVQNERTESAVRYFSQITERQNPYASYSFSSMFEQLGNDALPSIVCTVPSTDALSNAPATYASKNLSNATASPTFWTPTVPSSGCVSARIWGMQQNPAARQPGNMDMLFITKQANVTASVTVPQHLQSALGDTSFAKSSEFIYDQVGLNVLVACYPGFNTALTSSINYQTDTSADTAAAPILSNQDLFAADEGQFEYFAVSPSCL